MQGLEVPHLDLNNIEVNPLEQVRLPIGALTEEPVKRFDGVRFEQHEQTRWRARGLEHRPGEANARVEGLHQVGIERSPMLLVLVLNAGSEPGNPEDKHARAAMPSIIDRDNRTAQVGRSQ